jgi:hypothetical protein
MIENFVLEYPNFLTESECQSFLEYYERMSLAGFAYSRYNSDKAIAHDRSGDCIFMHESPCLGVEATSVVVRHFLKKFWDIGYKEYIKKYSILETTDAHKIYHLKLQKTAIGEGFHSWHFEDSSRMHSVRLLNFLCYLNTVDEGGETELLYYPKRIKAEAGKLLIMPAGYTHTHRGNPPLSNDKYILTGWVEYQ